MSKYRYFITDNSTEERIGTLLTGELHGLEMMNLLKSLLSEESNITKGNVISKLMLDYGFYVLEDNILLKDVNYTYYRILDESAIVTTDGFLYTNIDDVYEYCFIPGAQERYLQDVFQDNSELECVNGIYYPRNENTKFRIGYNYEFVAVPEFQYREHTVCGVRTEVYLKITNNNDSEVFIRYIDNWKGSIRKILGENDFPFNDYCKCQISHKDKKICFERKDTIFKSAKNVDIAEINYFLMCGSLEPVEMYIKVSESECSEIVKKYFSNFDNTTNRNGQNCSYSLKQYSNSNGNENHLELEYY